MRGRRSGRVRLQVVPDLSADALCGFVVASVEPGAVVHTDAWQGFERLSRLGFDHRLVSQRRGAEDVDEVLSRVHWVISRLKTWLAGTHRGVSAQQLPAYLDEFASRFDRRRTPMAALQTLLGLGSRLPPTTYDRIVVRKRLPERTG